MTSAAASLCSGRAGACVPMAPGDTPRVELPACVVILGPASGEAAGRCPQAGCSSSRPHSHAGLLWGCRAPRHRVPRGRRCRGTDVCAQWAGHRGLRERVGRGLAVSPAKRCRGECGNTGTRPGAPRSCNAGSSGCRYHPRLLHPPLPARAPCSKRLETSTRRESNSSRSS